MCSIVVIAMVKALLHNTAMIMHASSTSVLYCHAQLSSSAFMHSYQFRPNAKSDLTCLPGLLAVGLGAYIHCV